MVEQTIDVVKDEAKKARFKDLMSSVGELAEQVGMGSHKILEEDREVSEAVARALDNGITNVSIKTTTTGSLRIRTNDRGYGAKADFIIKSSSRRQETYGAGAGGGMPGETYRDFKWLGEPRSFSAEEIWNDVELIDVLVDTVDALNAVYDIQHVTKENKQAQD